MPTGKKQSGKKVYRKRVVRKSQSKSSKLKTNKPEGKISPLHFYGLIGFVVLFIIGLFGFGTFISDLSSRQAGRKSDSESNNNAISISQSSPGNSKSNESIPVDNLSANPQSGRTFASPSTDINSSADVSGNSGQIYGQIYNASNPPRFQESKKLNDIVDKVVKYTKDKNLPLDSFSVSLINLSDDNSPVIAGYKENTPRYPASVVKMFWMVALYGNVEKGLVQLDKSIDDQLRLMMIDSSNDAGGFIVDKLTDTNSSQNKLNKAKLKDWENKRNQVNLFFQQAGYQGININQKTFPLVRENISEPVGPDLQIRGQSTQKPIRNKITTHHAARLMYEISSSRASRNPDFSDMMFDLLTRDIKEWKAKPPNPMVFNAVESFFGDSLPPDAVHIASKAGITSSSRMEVAFITTKDRKTKYVLAVSGDHKAYARNKKIFPGISRLVYKQMTARK